MRHPLLVVCDERGELIKSLRDLAQDKAHRWFFRARQQPESCLRFLRRGSPGVLVLRTGGQLLGRRLEREYRLLERATALLPSLTTLVLCDLENAALVALAWDLGANYVLSPAQPRDHLPELVAGLMKAAIARSLPEGRRSSPKV